MHISLSIVLRMYIMVVYVVLPFTKNAIFYQIYMQCKRLTKKGKNTLK